MASWVCADCGATYSEKTTPCTECASERIARLTDDQIPDRVDSGPDIEWECTECGETHIKNNPPCNRCGNMTFDPIAKTQATPSQDTADDTATNPTRAITMRTLVAWGFGILAILSLTGALFTISPIAFILYLAAVYVSFPPARRHLKRRFNVKFSTAAAATIYVITTILGLIFLT